MKIWLNNGAEDVVLCDHGRGGPSNFVPQVVRRKEVLTFVQSAFAKPRALGNAHRVWTFGAKISHATYTDAQVYLLTLHQSIPEQTAVWVELEDLVTRYQLPDCVIEFSPTTPIGVLTTVIWTLTFGGMQTFQNATNLADLLGVELNDSEGTALTLNDATPGELT